MIRDNSDRTRFLVNELMDERPELADFEPLIGESFRLTGPHERLTFDVELMRAGQLRSGPEPDASFSLVFRGPVEHKLAQMIRQLHHPDLGNMEIFLVPVHEDETGRYYEAVFNYLG